MLFPFSFMQSQSAFDPDAQAFFNRVTAAGGTLSATEKTAVNTLVIQLKADGNWTPMKAIYPMVGASAAACAQNLKSSSFTGTFSSGWTFASTGVTPNGTSAYMDTNFVPSTNGLTYDNNHISFYSRTSAQSGTIQFYDMGSGNLSGTDNLSLFIRRNTDLAGYDSGDFTTNRATFTNTNGQGFYCGTAITTSSKYFKNGTSQVTKSLSVKSISSVNIYIGAFNENNATIYYSPKQCAFASIGDGLTDTQASNFYTAVQTFNQTLNRQVGAQIVSDADAQAYIDRVYTAGGTLTNTEANAVNQLTIDMKAAGIWTAMKAVYPMVGASAAACAQNLKSSSFTGSFTSGWTFASTGATPNGTSAYMDTNCNDNNFSSNSASLGVYSRTNSAVDTYDFGIYNTVSLGGSFMKLRQASNFGGGIQSTTELGFSNSDSRGFYQLAKNGSTTMLGYKNGSQVISGTLATVSASNTTSFLAALNNGGTPAFGYSTKEYAFAFLGDGLSGTNMSNLYTCVQTFQTTLSRQV